MENLANLIPEKNIHKYSLHQLLFLIEKFNENKKEFGTSSLSKQEACKLKAHHKLATNSSDIIKFSANTLTINHTSLIGANAILPQFYAEKIILQEKEKNTLLLEFLNIFHHRYFSLLHKTEKNRILNLNREPEFKEKKYISGLENLYQFLNPFISMFWQKTKTKSNLKHMIECIFSVNLQIEEFLKQCFEVEEEYQLKTQTKLKNKTLGKKAECYTKGITLIFNFISLQKLQSFLPGADNSTLLKKILSYYLEPDFKIRIKLKIDQHKLVSFKLNKQRLGICTYLGNIDKIYEYSYEL